MRVPIAVAAALALAACGGDAPENAARPAAGEETGSDAEVAADAALAEQAAVAEAEDAAIGGNMTAEDVSAAGDTAPNAQ
ncbi:MAG TPA: hypothetical protein VF582_05275 [Allosphingosinicella sp.]|jgi:hypothetical protein